MVNYLNGQIYKIVDVGFNECYVGSTCEDLKRRFQRHKDHHIEYKKGKRNYMTSSYLFNKYGIENCRIIWIKNYPCGSKKNLKQKKVEYNKKLIVSINIKQEGQENNGARTKKNIYKNIKNSILSTTQKRES